MLLFLTLEILDSFHLINYNVIKIIIDKYPDLKTKITNYIDSITKLLIKTTKEINL